MSVPRYRPVTTPTTSPVTYNRLGSTPTGLQPTPKQTGQDLLTDIGNQPPIADLTGYLDQQQQMWKDQLAAAQAQWGSQLAAMDQLTQGYNPNLGMREMNRLLGMFDTSELDAIHRQMMDAYGNQRPRVSTATYMIGYP